MCELSIVQYSVVKMFNSVSIHSLNLVRRSSQYTIQNSNTINLNNSPKLSVCQRKPLCG